MANINVQQLIFDVSVRDQATAISAQNRISAISNDITACIESILEKYDDPDSLISIQRLEMNLGSIEISRLEGEFLQGIARAIDRAMTEVLLAPEIRTLSSRTEVNRQTLAEREEDVIRHFLKTGLAIDQTTDLNITKTRIKKALYEIPALVDWFIHAQTQIADPLRRLLYHLDDPEVHALVLGQYFLALETISELIRSLASPKVLSQAHISYETVRLHVWRCVFKQKADGRTAFDYLEFIQDYAEDVSITLDECASNLPTFVIDELLQSTDSERLRRYLGDIDTTDPYRQWDEVLKSGDGKDSGHDGGAEVPKSSEWKDSIHGGGIARPPGDYEVSKSGEGKDGVRGGETESSPGDAGVQKSIQGKDEVHDGGSQRPFKHKGRTPADNVPIERQEGHAHGDLPTTQEAARDGNIEVPGKFYLSNAGMVLVAPFLGRFFNSLGFIEKEQFVDRERQQRSAVLLHYLNPRQEISENSVILNKLLCGLDIIEPVPVGIEPTETELKEIDELIRSVVHHWSALKSTSVEAFKHNFLNRTAILTNSEHQWHLHVKRESIDVLLETLPWSIAVIRHPWMKKVIMVEW